MRATFVLLFLCQIGAGRFVLRCAFVLFFSGRFSLLVCVSVVRFARDQFGTIARKRKKENRRRGSLGPELIAASDSYDTRVSLCVRRGSDESVSPVHPVVATHTAAPQTGGQEMTLTSAQDKKNPTTDTQTPK